MFQQGDIELEVMFVAPDEDSDQDQDCDDEQKFRSVCSCGGVCVYVNSLGHSDWASTHTDR